MLVYADLFMKYLFVLNELSDKQLIDIQVQIRKINSEISITQLKILPRGLENRN
jgi:hypothetical protein